MDTILHQVMAPKIQYGILTRIKQTLDDIRQSVYSLCINNKIASRVCDNKVIIWDSVSEQEVQRMEGHVIVLTNACFLLFKTRLLSK